MNWTKQQQQVIDTREGNLLVSAAAGSGKTAVLVERIIEMILGENSEGETIAEGIDLDELLVVTFTRAAASQMQEKIARVLEKKAEEQIYDEHIAKQLALLPRAEITTIDSFCLQIVKEHFHLLGLDASFDIADRTEMELMKSDVMDALLEACYQEEDAEFFTLIDSFARKESDAAVMDLVNRIYKVAVSFPRPYQWLQEAEEAMQIATKEQLMAAPWYQAYQESVRRILKSAKEMAEACIRICNQPGGPKGYQRALEADLEQLDSCLLMDNWDELCRQKMTFETLGRNRADQTDADLQKTVKNIRDQYKKGIQGILKDLKPSDEILREIRMTAVQITALLHLTNRYMRQLAEVKREKNVYEFHDIEAFALQIVCAGYDENGRAIPSEAGRTISRRYREILIDEYQDSNFLQEDILQCVSGHGQDICNMFMVGDIKQSIYRFRMARPDLFLDKYLTYSEESSDHRRIVLSCNFRSTDAVLTVVNAVFSSLMGAELGGIAYDEDAALRSPRQMTLEGTGHKAEPAKQERPDPENELILVDNHAETPEEKQDAAEAEAMAIANRIHQLVDGDNPYYVEAKRDAEGHPVYRRAAYGDIVILTRGVKPIVSAFDTVFQKAGIPLWIESENGYFDAVEIQTVLSFLAITDNAYLDYDLAAVLRSPIAELNENELAYVVGSYNMKFRETEQDRKLSRIYLYEKILYYVNHKQELEEGITVSIADKLERFLKRLSYLKENKPYMTISEMIHYILDETGYYWYVGAMQMGKRRQANLDMLIDQAEHYEKSSFRGLFHFLRYIEQLKIHELDFAEADISEGQENAVRIMTIHKSKGLEFPIVFVSMLGKAFSNIDAKEPVVIHSDYYLASQVIDPVLRIRANTCMRRIFLQLAKQEAYAEEMRILYVAMTRAKEKLIMTACTDSPETLLNQCGYPRVKAHRLSYIDKMSASSYIEWILSALSASGQADEILHFVHTDTAAESEIFSDWSRKRENNMPDVENTAVRQEIYDRIKANLEWVYPYEKKRQIKSKMSVTEIKRLQQKGEENPGEALFEQAGTQEKDDIPTLAILQKERRIMGNEIGTVMHKIMELIDFHLASEQEVQRQVDIMFESGRIDEMFRPYIHYRKIYHMLNSSLGRRMAEADAIGLLYREQQFYIAMEPGSVLPDYEGTSDEPVVVQGIIDAYFIEAGKAYLLDYKTDRTDSLEALVEKYHVQLEKYAETIERITGYTVGGKCIYSFHKDDFIWL